MFDRLAVGAMAAVVAIGALTLGVSLMTRPGDPAAAACPPTQLEANAIDAFDPGLPQSERAWASRGEAPAPGRGWIAAFAGEPPDNAPGTVFLVDPAGGSQCPIIRLSSKHPVRGPFATSLDWSPFGDALALGLEGAERPGGQEDGVVLVWSADRLMRIWSGEGTPNLEWAPDGRSVAVWTGWTTDLRIIHADGSPDRTVGVRPYGSGLLWSPDGTRLFVSEAAEEIMAPDSALSIVDFSDGRVTPLGDFGTGHILPVTWVDEDRVVVAVTERGRRGTGWFAVSISDPSTLREMAIPRDVPNYAVPSPDGTRLLYVAADDGDDWIGTVNVISITGEAPAHATQLAPALRAGPVGLAWSPDGQQVLLQEAGGGLWTVNADGTGLRQVAPGDLVPIDSPWQPVPLR